ncbi:hypothetical protein JXB01_02600 [Candidatus Micrarchaeota archaeon]|nr:hypothetical protein [Candidatus Micrarchaeota archaeon]
MSDSEYFKELTKSGNLEEMCTYLMGEEVPEKTLFKGVKKFRGENYLKGLVNLLGKTDLSEKAVKKIENALLNSIKVCAKKEYTEKIREILERKELTRGIIHKTADILLKEGYMTCLRTLSRRNDLDEETKEKIKRRDSKRKNEIVLGGQKEKQEERTKRLTLQVALSELNKGVPPVMQVPPIPKRKIKRRI